MTTQTPVRVDDETWDEIEDAGRCKCQYEGRTFIGERCPVPCRNQMDGEDRWCSLCRQLNSRPQRGRHCHAILAGWTT